VSARAEQAGRYSRRDERARIVHRSDVVARNVLEQHLAQAERHVLQGDLILERQRRLIDQRLRDGRDIELAVELLAQMEEMQRMHLADRDRLRDELEGKRGA
jgi:hypothetical protein